MTTKMFRTIEDDIEDLSKHFSDHYIEVRVHTYSKVISGDGIGVMGEEDDDEDVDFIILYRNHMQGCAYIPLENITYVEVNHAPIV